MASPSEITTTLKTGNRSSCSFGRQAIKRKSIKTQAGAAISQPISGRKWIQTFWRAFRFWKSARRKTEMRDSYQRHPLMYCMSAGGRRTQCGEVRSAKLRPVISGQKITSRLLHFLQWFEEYKCRTNPFIAHGRRVVGPTTGKLKLFQSGCSLISSIRVPKYRQTVNSSLVQMQATRVSSDYKLAIGLENVVAILCYGRSGSTFFQSLLDGHPNLIVTAGLHLHPFHSFFEENGTLPAMELLAKFIEDFAVIFDARNGWRWEPTRGDYAHNFGFNRMGPERDQSLAVDQKIFAQCMTGILNEHAARHNDARVPRKLFMQAVYVAYQKAIGRAISEKSIMVHPLHSPYPQSHAAQLAQDFPAAKYIFVLRRPIDTLASHFRSLASANAVCAAVGSALINGVLIGGESHRVQGCEAASAFLNSISPSSSLSKRLKTHSRGITLEDLHKEPRGTLGEVCRWLGVPWDDALLTSTFHGMRWWNLASSPQISGFTKVTTAEKPVNDVMTSIDEFVLKVLLARKYEAWNYELPWFYSTILAKLLVLPLLFKPLKMELMSWSSEYTRFRKPRPILKAYLSGRRRLLTAWLAAISPAHPETELLQLRRSQR